MKKQEDSVHFKFIIMKKNIIPHIISVMIIALSTSCIGIYEDGADLAVDVVKQIHQLPIDSLNAMTERNESFTLIDIRQKTDFYSGNIAGSVNIPRGILEFKIADEAFWFEQYMYPPEKNSMIILYSETGDLGALATLSIQRLGYSKVYNLAGGYKSISH